MFRRGENYDEKIFYILSCIYVDVVVLNTIYMRSEYIRYDFIIGDYGIKYFSLNSDKDLRKIMNDIKAWAWNSEHYGLVRPIIVYNTDITDKASQQYTDLQSIIDIFKESSARVYLLENVSSEFDPQVAI